MARESQDPVERDPVGETPERAAPSGPIGVLALQGSFPLHLAALARLGVPTRAVTRPSGLDGLAGLIVPGGESTTVEHLARDYGLFDPLVEAGRGGLPFFGTCAGAILLGRGEPPPQRLEIAPVEARRNAYGSQVDSFTAALRLAPLEAPFHGVFIRAPRLVVGPERDVEILGSHGGDPVLVRWRHVLLATFHPELTEDLRVHQLFLSMCR